MISGLGPLGTLLKQGGLYPVFQPIVNLSGDGIHAHEALIRGPKNTALHTPDVLLQAAAAECLGFDFEYACIRAALTVWGQKGAPGRLFVNISATVLMELVELRGAQELLGLIRGLDVAPRMLVLELTEHERVPDMDALSAVVAQVRANGVALALDDFGDGRSSLRLWSQIKPEVVKIDKYFTRNISQHGDKLKTLQALLQIADVFGTALVAEGIETADDLRVVRDLGIAYGQGYFLGHPNIQPARYLDVAAQRVLAERNIVVFPELKRAAPSGLLSTLALIQAPTVTMETTNDALAICFAQWPSLPAVAVVERERPIGIVNRSRFMNEYSKLYYREVWGRRPCVEHINFEPRVIERQHSVDELVGILTSEDQRYLSDGFIVTENGRYIGLGTGDQLVRSVTEARVEAARHANPLTFLPGNIPISQHMERLLRRRTRFVACYADLNHFKPFNDCYGYWRGDQVIRLMARVAQEHCDAQLDFLGHVGGDDFMLLFQSPDWRARVQRMVQAFNTQALALFDETARLAGGIEAEDRYGVRRFFPCTTVSVGAVVVEAGGVIGVDEVANQAAMAKQEAKKQGVGLYERELAVPA